MGEVLERKDKRNKELIIFYYFKENDKYVFSIEDLMSTYQISKARIYQILKSNHIQKRREVKQL